MDGRCIHVKRSGAVCGLKAVSPVPFCGAHYRRRMLSARQLALDLVVALELRIDRDMIVIALSVFSRQVIAAMGYGYADVVRIRAAMDPDQVPGRAPPDEWLKDAYGEAGEDQ